MAVPQRFYGPGTVPTLAAQPVSIGLQDGCIVKGLYVANTTAGSLTFSAWLVPPGGTAQPSNLILTEIVVDAHSTFVWDQSLPFKAGDALWMVASATGLNASWHGYAPGVLDAAGANEVLATVAPVLGPYVDFAGTINPDRVTVIANPDGTYTVGLDVTGDGTPDTFIDGPDTALPAGTTVVDLVLDNPVTPIGANPLSTTTVGGDPPLAADDTKFVTMGTNPTAPIPVLPEAINWSTPVDPWVALGAQVLAASLVILAVESADLGEQATIGGRFRNGATVVELLPAPFTASIVEAGQPFELRSQPGTDPATLTAMFVAGATLEFDKLQGNALSINHAVVRLTVLVP
jgi:hypothetical protein